MFFGNCSRRVAGQGRKLKGKGPERKKEILALKLVLELGGSTYPEKGAGTGEGWIFPVRRGGRGS